MLTQVGTTAMTVLSTMRGQKKGKKGGEKGNKHLLNTSTFQVV